MRLHPIRHEDDRRILTEYISDIPFKRAKVIETKGKVTLGKHYHNNNDSVFYMTNMIPQNQTNNGGPWEILEGYCRALALQGNVLYIISGGVGDGGVPLLRTDTVYTIQSGKIAVPAKTWKVIMVLPAGTNDVSRVTTTTRCIAVVMDNDNGPFNAWSTYRTSVDSVEALTGYDFFSNVSPSIQAVIEAVVDTGPTN